VKLATSITVMKVLRSSIERLKALIG